MTQPTRDWSKLRSKGWALVKTQRGSYQYWCLTDPNDKGVASLMNTGYYPLSCVYDWAVNKIAELGAKHE